MGWANCGEDSIGRPIGYAHEATCDHPGCDEQIDRGLSYACGDMHGQLEYGCEGYFCEPHRVWVDLPDDTTFYGDGARVCLACAKTVPACQYCGDSVPEGTDCCPECNDDRLLP